MQPRSASVSREVHSFDCEKAVEERTPPGIEQTYDLEMKLIGPDGGDGLRQFLASIGSHPAHPLLEGWLAKLESYRTSVGGFSEYWAALHQFRAGIARGAEHSDFCLAVGRGRHCGRPSRSAQCDVYRGG